MKRRWLTVARRELVATLKSRTFLVTTFGMPLFLVFMVLLAAAPGLYMASRRVTQGRGVFGIVDLSKRLPLEGPLVRSARPQLAAVAQLGVAGRAVSDAVTDTMSRTQGEVILEPFPTVEAAQQAVAAGKIRAALVFPLDYMETGALDMHLPKSAGGLTGRNAPQWLLNPWIVETLVGESVDKAAYQRIMRPITETRTFRQQEDGTFAADDPNVIRQLRVPFVFLVLLAVAIMSCSGYLMQGVAEEKENRVFEILLSSISPEELLQGKLVGLGAVGLIQLAIWATSTLVFALVMFPLAFDLAPAAVAVALAYFVLGYLFLGSLILGVGSLGQNFRESQQWGAAFTVAGVLVPILFVPVIVDEQQGLIARVVCLIPPTAAVCMPFRFALGVVHPAELAVSLAINATAVFTALRISGTIYRVGSLLHGRLSPGDLYRAIRAAARSRIQ